MEQGRQKKASPEVLYSFDISLVGTDTHDMFYIADKIFPSPTLPVRAASIVVLFTCST